MRPQATNRYLGKSKGVDKFPAQTRPWLPLNHWIVIMGKRLRTTEKPSAPDPIAIIGGILSLGVIRSINRARMEANKTAGMVAPRSAKAKVATFVSKATGP